MVEPENLTRVDLIKIDVEGLEGSVFRGAASVIKKFRPVIIFENWIDESAEKTIAPFRELSKIVEEYKFFIVELVRDENEEFQVRLKEMTPEDRSLYEERINVVAICS